jgi:DNA-binding transcriptional ArsR family regulator
MHTPGGGTGMMAASPIPNCPTMQGLPPEALEQVAGYFQALSEPTRLQLLNFLREGERSVGELARLCGCTAANVSRHLSLLTRRGLVARESRGTSVYYRIADASVYALCDLVCGNVARTLEHSARGHELFAQAAPRD